MITVAFVFWGIGPKDNPTIAMAAQVEDIKISVDQYYRAYDNEYKRLSEQYTDKEELDKLDIQGRVISSLINRTVLLIAAEKTGITVTEEELQEAIINTPYFQRDGIFDPNVYKRALRLNRITPQIFERGLKSDMIIAKISRLIGETAELSPEEQKILDSIEGGNKEQITEVFRSTKTNQTISAYIESIKRQLKITINQDIIT
jgi:peptidyl-prolyl cis-trans isomerase D